MVWDAKPIINLASISSDAGEKTIQKLSAKAINCASRREEPTVLAAARATANGPSMTQINHHAAFDFPLLHFIEDLIDIFDRTQCYLRHHLALRGKLEGFYEVLSSTDQ